MGWNTWYTFGTDIQESVILEMADALLRTGLAESGYRHVVIDDGWSLRRRAKDGTLVPDPEKFPSGIRRLSEQMHRRGLKLGLYSCCGLATCAGYPSSLDYEWLDAKTFADWEIDFLKYDYCHKPAGRNGSDLYRTMGLALANSGREIIFSACSWGLDQTHEWIRSTSANLWRCTGDISDNWVTIKNIFLHQYNVHAFSTKGCFSDLDMLMVGMRGSGKFSLEGCSETEYRTHFAAWCLFQSPLMIACDLRKADEESLRLLKNPLLLSIHQDEACRQTIFLKNFWDECRETPILVRLLHNGDLAIGLFNLSDARKTVICTLPDLGIPVHSGKTLRLCNCWNETISYPENHMISADLAPHDCVVYRASICSACHAV